jgi:hypothetical protein
VSKEKTYPAKHCKRKKSQSCKIAVSAMVIIYACFIQQVYLSAKFTVSNNTAEEWVWGFTIKQEYDTFIRFQIKWDLWTPSFLSFQAPLHWFFRGGKMKREIWVAWEIESRAKVPSTATQFICSSLYLDSEALVRLVGCVTHIQKENGRINVTGESITQGAKPCIMHL